MKKLKYTVAKTKNNTLINLKVCKCVITAEMKFYKPVR